MYDYIPLNIYIHNSYTWLSFQNYSLICIIDCFHTIPGVYKTTEIHFFYPPPTFENHFFYPYTRMFYKLSKANKKHSKANNALFTS